LQEWKKDLAGVNARAADALADPEEYPNLFPGLDEAAAMEAAVAKAQARGVEGGVHF
jgi:coatomer subunit beta'